MAGNREREREREHEHDLELLRALRPIDDDFMRCLFQGQLSLAQELLRAITGIQDLELVREETQYDLKRLVGARSVCLDVFGVDSQGLKYDLEVQRAAAGAGARRARYYSAALDVDSLGAGGGFAELPESYIIFVCEKDPFGCGAGVYRFERVDQRASVTLDDGTHILYVNASYDADDELGALMHDFLCSDPAEMRNTALADRAKYFKESPKGVAEMCELLEEMREEALAKGLEQGLEQGRAQGLEQGRAQGLEQGLEQGEAKNRAASVAALMRNARVSAQQAMDLLEIPPAERDRCLAML